MRATVELGDLRLQAGGTLNPRRHLYIERPDDAVLLQLLAEGQYVNILTSRQMGKSSLMVQAAEALIGRGVRCAIVDLAAELGTPDDRTAYFLGLLSKIGRDLKIEVDLQVWWAERPEETVNQRLMRFFREAVLEQVAGPVVCFLDEIDSTLNPKLTWTDDLFTALRGMHNERPMVPAYERLTFCLIGVAAPNELIKDRRTTPYNVGRTLELRDFDLGRDDLTPLAAALSDDPGRGPAMIERVLHWTGGHPYLTTRLCASLQDIGAKGPQDVDQRVEDSFRTLDRVSNDVHFQQILRFLETRLSDGLATYNLYERILKGVRERDRPTLAHTELKLSGLVKRDEEGCLVVRNRIYQRLFDLRWAENAKPKRALVGYRRWAIAASIVLLIVVVGAGFVIFNLQAQLNALRLTLLGVEVTDYGAVDFPYFASQELLEQAAAPLASLTNLRRLGLSETRVADVAPLANLTNLQTLDLSNTQVADVAPLANLTNLQTLDLSNTQVADVAPLANLTNLQTLDLSNTQVADAAPLAKLTNLQMLDLTNTQVADAAPLANLTNLERLSLKLTSVADAPFANLTHLQCLDLSDTQVADVAPLAKLSNLDWLSLTGTQVADVAPLAKLSNLDWLSLTGTQVADVAPLAKLTNLQWLSLDGTQVADVAPLAKLTNLETLDLSNTQVADVAALAKLTSLETLDLSNTQVADVAPLSELTNLETLDLSNTQVAGVAALANLPNLRRLDLSDTQVADVATLLASITDLDVYGGDSIRDPFEYYGDTDWNICD